MHVRFGRQLCNHESAIKKTPTKERHEWKKSSRMYELMCVLARTRKRT